MFVETQSLGKRYGRVMALDACTFGIESGEVFGLLGPNGAGKTTLLRLLMAYLKPTTGSARIAGLDCYRDTVAVHARVAYLPGETRLFRSMRGRDVLAFLTAIRRDGSLPRALALAQRLQFDLATPVAAMSTGTRQKLALAAVFAIDAPLLVLDEPTSNLDPTVRAEIASLVVEAKRAGRTVLFSSHVLSEVEEVCDRVAILRRGQLVHTQAMSELRRQHRIRARLTGAMPPLPEALRNEVSVRPGDAGNLTIETPGELAPLLGWLATLPLAEVRIEPFGLRAVYDRFHAPQES